MFAKKTNTLVNNLKTTAVSLDIDSIKDELDAVKLKQMASKMTWTTLNKE